MPNHIQNMLLVSGDSTELAKFVSYIKDEDVNDPETGKVKHIDFNKIVPMPEGIKHSEESTKKEDALYLYCHFNGLIDEAKKLVSPFMTLDRAMMCIMSNFNSLDKALEYGESVYKLYLETGATSWYDWSLKNWGTKWNAYNTYVHKNDSSCFELYFQTAWSGVPGLITKLVKEFPTLQFTYKYADEDMGYNCGEGHSDGDGDFSFTMVSGGSDEAIALYIECWQEDEDDFYKDDEGCWHNRQWEWDEDEE